jgi:hypothetical protein
VLMLSQFAANLITRQGVLRALRATGAQSLVRPDSTAVRCSAWQSPSRPASHSACGLHPELNRFNSSWSQHTRRFGANSSTSLAWLGCLFHRMSLCNGGVSDVRGPGDSRWFTFQEDGGQRPGQRGEWLGGLGQQGGLDLLRDFPAGVRGMPQGVGTHIARVVWMPAACRSP